MTTTLISRCWTLTATLAACSLALFGVLGPTGPEDGAESVIVQGQDLASATAAVRSVGGTVTHELGVIDAVGARLRPDQIQRLRGSRALRHVWADGEVRTSSGCGVVAWSSPVIDDDKIEWDLTNHSTTTVTLSKVELEWPTDHGSLKEIKLAGDVHKTLSPPPALVVTSGWEGDPKDRQIESGKTETLKFEFEEKTVAPPSEYSIRVEFAEGCGVAAVGDDAGRDVSYPAQVGADELHELGLDGEGVAVAILDTGWYDHGQIKHGRRGEERVRAVYDAIEHEEKDAKDENGHGTHVASIVAASDKRKDKKKDGVERFAGMAPDASLVVVRAFGEEGWGTYADVIRGIDWVVAHRDIYGIRVLNCSFSAPVRSHYWEDPINQAVMAAWEAGIVVVASAGNTGPGPMSVGVPGNVPYVITVGALTDSYTPFDPSDDKLASFSAAGPTYEGFVKPDVVAPGGHIVGIMKGGSKIAKRHPRFASPYKELFMMSGTSQSTAIVSGIVAMMLQANPDLGPDDVKCGLMASARAAHQPDGTSAYSVFQQGAGIVNAHDAVYEGHWGCANGGLDVTRDLDGLQHFGGPASQDQNGNFYLLDETGDGTAWDGTYSGTEGYPWSDGYPWSNGYPWSAGLAESASINFWVPQE